MSTTLSSTPNETMTEGSRGGSHEPARVYLLVFHGDSSRMIPLRADGDVVIGRDAVADVVLSDAAVSRKHACLTLIDGLATLRDLDSANGTKINGEAITGSRPLVSGDVLTIGSATISFQTSSRRPAAREFLSLTQLQEHASTEIERSSRFQRPLAMLAINLGLDGRVDRVAVARALEARLRVLDSIGWSGSDQLLLVQPETDAAGARIAADALLGVLQRIAPAARAGVASWPDDGDDVDTLIGSARMAAQVADPGGVADADRSPSTRTIGTQVVVVADPAMSRVYGLIERLAKTDLTVLVYGETGTGKELATTALHHWSARAAHPLVSLNCAAITESIVERELFGHEKGAFSGAVATREGLLEAADKGTVFLDEIGELSLAIQAKLLRVLETKRLTRIGDVREREIDIRIVAATNRDLEAAIEAGTFRRDLYYRLCGATLWLPPLRDRRRELPLLAQRFLSEACSRIGRDALVLSSTALHVLSSYDWPGNVRELKNVMDYLAATCEDVVQAEQIAARLRTVRPPMRSEMRPEMRSIVEPAPPEPPAAGGKTFRPLEDELRELEKRRIEEALAAFAGNQTRAAEAISMPLRTFVNKVRQYNLSPRSAKR
ncbi:MAG: sigma 54-interacting transcriptional regulator [Deltaproteobacteria bacterium]|nr:sigma 54-interacting transcriptional regulator [Deltaproteobacteria bacterium]